MVIVAEYCCGAGFDFWFRLKTKAGKYLGGVVCDDWTRAAAADALDLLEKELPKVSRSNIRFEVR